MITMSLSCLFVGFAGSMLSDAVSTIRSDTTAIDKLKGISFEERKDEGLRCVLVCRVMDRVYFGGDGHFSWRWLVPVAPRFRYLEELRGYRVECFEVWCVCFALLLSVLLVISSIVSLSLALLISLNHSTNHSLNSLKEQTHHHTRKSNIETPESIVASAKRSPDEENAMSYTWFVAR